MVFLSVAWSMRNPFCFTNMEPSSIEVGVESVAAKAAEIAQVAEPVWQLEAVNTGTMLLKNSEGQVREISMAPTK